MINPPHFDTAICGGGMVGMSLGLALAQAGLKVAIIEKTTLPAHLEPQFDGRVSAIAEGSRRVLAAIGAWDSMQPHAEPILDIRVSDSNAPIFLHYDHKEVGDIPFGAIIENRHIRHALHNVAYALPSLTLFEQTQLEYFERDDAGITLHLKNKQAIRCRLLIGADGKQSQVRKLAGIKTLEWQYRQTAIVCTITHELPHNGLAQERFLPAGPFAVLPLSSPSPLEGESRGDGDSKRKAGKIFLAKKPPIPNPPPQGGRELPYRSSLVWVEPQERVRMYMELPEEEFVQEIKERVGDYLGAIATTGQRFSYPLSLMHAKSYIAPRLALIGDAAHAIHPIAGQGVNLGFRDVGVLSELIIKQFRLGLDIGSDDVLTHYQRWRRFDNIAMLAVTDGINRLFSNSIPPIQLARDLGLWAVSKLPLLKQFFMRDAMGLAGDLPVMMQDSI